MPETPAEPTITEPVAAAPAEPAPPWGEDFDPAKAWGLIQNLRSDKEKLSAREILTPEHKARLAEYDKLAEASKTELERAQEAATRATQQMTAVTNRAIQAEVRALAAEKFADPSDAAAFLDTAKYAKEDGEIDVESMATDLADLLVRKPHLGKQVDPRTPAPNPAQGASASGVVTPDIDRQIEDATKAGNLQLAISLKQQRSAELLAKKS